jgi:hypothetical protein
MKKLVLVKGGKIDSGEGKGPLKTGRPKRPHPFNDLLWRATSRQYYQNRAVSVEEIGGRMTKLSRRVMGTHYDVSTDCASHCIYDCRRRWRTYDWTLMHAQKGRGDFGGFVPVLVDAKNYDTAVYAIYDEDLPYVMYGLISSIATYDSMIQNDADSMPLLIACLEAMGKWDEANAMREFNAEIRAFSRRSAEMRKKALDLI